MKIKTIIKDILIILLIVGITICFCFITTISYHFDKAQIRMPDGTTVEGKVDGWAPDSGMLRVKIDGVIYYTHVENVVLISEGN